MAKLKVVISGGSKQENELIQSTIASALGYLGMRPQWPHGAVMPNSPVAVQGRLTGVEVDIMREGTGSLMMEVAPITPEQLIAIRQFAVTHAAMNPAEASAVELFIRTGAWPDPTPPDIEQA